MEDFNSSLWLAIYIIISSAVIFGVITYIAFMVRSLISTLSTSLVTLVEAVRKISPKSSNSSTSSTVDNSKKKVSSNRIIYDIFNELYDMVRHSIGDQVPQIIRCPYFNVGSRIKHELDKRTIDMISSNPIRKFIEIELRFGLSPSVSGYFAMVCHINRKRAGVESDLDYITNTRLFDHAKYRFTVAMMSAIEEIILTKDESIFSSLEYQNYVATLYNEQVNIRGIYPMMSDVTSEDMLMALVDGINFNVLFPLMDIVIAKSGLTIDEIMVGLRKQFTDPVYYSNKSQFDRVIVPVVDGNPIKLKTETRSEY